MRTVILRDGWIFRGEVSSVSGEVTITQGECLARGAGKWQPPAGARIVVPTSSIVAVLEG